MGVRRQQGFTIIEVSLFLAISSLMAILLLGGWTSMINTQRYKDSNKSLQSFLQDQYNLVHNTENGRDNTLKCADSDVTVGSGVPRGQTDCVLMGRYIVIKNGEQVMSYPIIGQEPASYEPMSNDEVTSIKSFTPKISTEDIGISRNELTMSWGATIVKNDGTVRNHAIVIIRSPEVDSTHTFNATLMGPDVLKDVTDIIDGSEADLPLCIEPGSSLVGGRLGIVIKASASSQSGVQVIPEGDTRC